MATERFDLDGAVITLPNDAGLALVFQGRSHAIENANVQNALFVNKPLESIGQVKGLAEGEMLNDGSCLIRAEGEHGIFLLTGLPKTRRCLITSFEAFTKFGFDMDKVRNVPWLVLQAIPVGPEIRIVQP